MSGSRSADKAVDRAIKALERRAQEILRVRPAYTEIVEFYLTVFRLQIEWRDKLVVKPEKVDGDQLRECLAEGRTLIERYDPGIEPESLVELWIEMKAVFGRGNDVLRQVVDRIDRAESAGDLVPATWLAEQRPDRPELIADVARRMDVDEHALASLTRAVTFPHWKLVSESWLPRGRLKGWTRFRCPTCGGLPALVEIRPDRQKADGVKPPALHSMLCAFCGSRWAASTIVCAACGSNKPGDAKYYFTAEEPELRIDFCKSCNHYVKVLDAGKITGPIHLGLELLTTTHLDAIAQAKSLKPLEVCA